MNDEEDTAVEGSSSDTGLGPAPAGPQVVRRPLRRSRTNRIFAGVAGGLGQYLGIDPIMVRLAIVVLTLLGGAGLALYLAAWILVPLEGDPRSVGEEAMGKATAYFDREFGDRRDRSWIWIALLVIGGLIIVSNLGNVGRYERAWFWAVLLIAGGVWLYRQDALVRNPGGPPTGAGAGANVGAGEAAGPTTASPVGIAHHPSPPRSASTPRVRTEKPPGSRLSRYTFALGLVALGTLAMLDNAGILDVTAAQYAAVALISAGAGLVVGSVLGRARSLIFWGLLLVPFVLVADQIDLPADGASGDRLYAPTSANEVEAQHRMFAGNMSFELSEMEWGADPVEINANLGMGQIEIEVPEGVDVKFRGHVGIGAVNLFGRERSGSNVGLKVDEETGEGPELIVDADMFIGEIVVRRTPEQARESS